MKKLFQASFSSEVGHSAMNSKWCSRCNCAVEIEMSPEAAALLNFGNSPFILKEGEDKDACKKSIKGAVSHGNIKPNEVGGMDADDLASLGDESNAKTVFLVDDDKDEYENDDLDDDVSSMGDDDFDEDSEDEEEKTVAGGDDDGDEYMEDVSGDDDDSAFSTVNDHRKDLDGLKQSGRNVRGEAEEAATRVRVDAALHNRIDELEEKKKQMEQQMSQKVSALENMMSELMKQLAAQNAINDGSDPKAEGKSDATKDANDEEHSGPGAAVTGEKEGTTSPVTCGSSASAGIK